jgi:dipeptidyl-peptidase-4
VWSSERDGYNHVYLYNRDGTVARQLTHGDWDVLSVLGADERRGWLYYTAAQPVPMERQLFRVRLDGARTERLTREAGTHGIAMSPDFSFYVDTWSQAGVPPTTRLFSTDGRLSRVLAENANLAQKLDRMGLRKPEFFQFETSEGVALNGYIIKPPDFDAGRRYAALLYVYGGPGSQTVTDAWGGSRYLWHQLLAERGILVVSVDNRGTGARGRDFKKVTYLNLGAHETRDQAEAAQYLAGLPYVDANRIGIWGWSYGGYMTALSMMNSDRFAAGVSVAPVSDWRLYDTIYTERFMRTPEENPTGYTESSAVARAGELSGHLLLVHGTGDDNVHFQNSTQLINALQAENEQFDLMIYPNRTHSISGGNTTVHLFNKITSWLLDNLATSSLPTS